MKKNLNNLLKSSVLIIWILISFFEISTYFLIKNKPIIWRAWEVVSNYSGKDASYIPFKPRYVYKGYISGDLINIINFDAKKSEKRFQKFIVDEYGFRNRVGMLKKPIDVVILGTSFVAGAAEDQKNLVSEILTKKYGIRTYNASWYNVQAFSEDSRFIKNPPKYLILLGVENELIIGTQRYIYTDYGIMNNIRKWNSYEEWERVNDPYKYDFKDISNELKNFSMTRYLANLIYVKMINFGRSREEVAESSKQNMVYYDKETGMLFFQPNIDIPILGSSGKTKKDVQKAVIGLKQTQGKLKKKGITLIVAAMPSKAHLELKKYRNLPAQKRAIVYFEQELSKSGIEHVELFKPMYDYIKTTNKHLYYPDDSHWNATANRIISKILSEKIKEIESLNKGSNL